ncbi:MAG TPA: class I SAM-dependent methyltransferase [Gaiellaceae bacterium]
MTDLSQIPDLGPSPYDAIAELYDPWSKSVVEDVPFYVAEARKAGGPIVELGVGTGRIAIPIAHKVIHVIGIDSSREMLTACRRRAEDAGVSDRIELRLGDLRHPPIDEPVSLVICPFRSYLHLADDGERVEALEAARSALVPEGRLVFDVFAPTPDDIAETHGSWLEREPGIFERADWDTETRTLTLSVRGPEGAATMSLSWISRDEWQQLLEETGFTVEASYGWFDRTPYRGGEDMIFVASRA